MKTESFQWWPRALCIAAILFISLFAADSFSPGLSFWQQITGFLIHLIPSFILIGVLLLAWKRELTGGILLILISLGFTPFVFKLNYNPGESIWHGIAPILLVTMPFLIAGILFIISHKLRTRKLTT